MTLFKLATRLLDQLLMAVAAWLGPRTNEVFGLKWRDIDFLAGIVHFRQGLVEGRLSSLKTEASREDEPLPDVIRHLLTAWRAQTPTAIPTTGFLLHRRQGASGLTGPDNCSSPTSNLWRQRQASVGSAGIRSGTATPAGGRPRGLSCRS